MLQCPLCKFTLVEHQKEYSCKNNHHFDKSKSGYTNLFLSNSKKLHGDNDLMIQARHRFLEQGHYAFLLNQLVELFHTMHIRSCADFGCGEGYYTNHLATQFPTLNFIGIDLSKTALKIASKPSNVRYFCASIADTPLADASIDCVLCIFAPFKITEVKRVLKPGGLFICVHPMPKHLYELKELLYETVKLNPVFILEDPAFKQIQTKSISHTLELNKAATIRDLLDMTPYRYNANKSNIDAFYALTQLKSECSFQCDVYKII